LKQELCPEKKIKGIETEEKKKNSWKKQNNNKKKKENSIT
jgi:hypothetical protein